MKFTTNFSILWLILILVVTSSSQNVNVTKSFDDNFHEQWSSPQNLRSHRFTLTKDGFQLDGAKFEIHAGEIHYFRIASCQWQDRLRKLQNSGLNAVSTAIEWALHEPHSGIYEWNEDANFERFIELAKELKLFVIVRAGPFIGADRDLGGLPCWLLGINRTEERRWMHRSTLQYRHYAERWLSHLLPKISRMLIANGGPIIMVQIDSDFGASGPCEAADWLYDIFVRYLGSDVIFFTMESNVYQRLLCGRIQKTISGFRTEPEEYENVFNGSVSRLFSAIENIAPGLPRIVELRTGNVWAWGSEPLVYDTSKLTESLAAILSIGASFIIYMFAGGTNFERSGNGGDDRMGLTTSYYDDAMLNENGETTEKFHEIRTLLAISRESCSIDKTVSLEIVDRVASYPDLKFESLGSLIEPEVLSKFSTSAVTSSRPLTFAEIGTTSGPVLYETRIPWDYRRTRISSREADLRCTGIRDRAYVYMGKYLAGVMNHARHTLLAVDPRPGQVIRIIVESQGYVAHGTIGDDKGIVSSVFLEATPLLNWTMRSMDFLENANEVQRVAEILGPRPSRKRGNGLYRATFTVSEGSPEVPADFFLDIDRFGKGRAYLNSRNLGKFWPKAGPQRSMYVPGCLLEPWPRVNKLLIVEMQRPFGGEVNNVQTSFVDDKLSIVRAKNDSLSGNSSNPAILLLAILVCINCNLNPRYIS